MMLHDTGDIPDRDIKWPVEVDNVFLTAMFLNDFPQFRTLFAALGMPDNLPLQVNADAVRDTLARRFNAGFSIHDAGRIGSDLAKFVPHAKDLSSASTGYMTRYGENYMHFHVAITIADKTTGQLDRGTVIHEYGHYVDQNVAAHRGYAPGPYVKRDTAFMGAFELINKMEASTAGTRSHYFAADELVAWLNALWLCRILNIDPRTVVVGMILDTISQPSGNIGFVKACLTAIANTIVDRSAGERMFNAAGPYTLHDALCPDPDGNDDRLCAQIDGTTSALLEAIRTTCS